MTQQPLSKRRLEIIEFSLNHWPALTTLLYDGWVLRFSDGYTKRANSINPIYDSTDELNRKILACENMYAVNHLPIIFKITPYVHPENLDSILDGMGYSMVDPLFGNL